LIFHVGEEEGSEFFINAFVALAGSILVKETEPEGNPKDFPSTHRLSNELYMLLPTFLF